MARHCALYLTTDGLRWYQDSGGQPQLLHRFPASDEGVAQFAAELRAHPASQQYSVLVDLADEGFNLDHVPAIHGRDRAAMLQRKLAQQFYGSPYSTALSLGREKDGRRDERILFSALTRPVQVEPWINVLIAARVRVRGVHSVPFVLDRVMARARVPAASCLLVNFTPGGVRQTYFQAGRLRFSRLSAAHDADFGRLVQICGDEIRKTVAYLAGQRLTPRGEPLPVVALVSGSQFAAFREAAAQAGEHPLSLADTTRLRQAYAPDSALDEASDSLPLLLGALVAESQCPQIGGSDVVRFQRIHQVRTGLHVAALAILFLGAVVGAFRAYEIGAVRKETDHLRRLASAEDERYRRLIDALPPLPAPLEELRALAASLERVERSTLPAEAVFLPLSRTLDQYPELNLERLRWALRDEPAGSAAVPGVVASATLRLPERLASDQRGMLETSEAFAEELARQTGRRTRLVKRPVDIQSTQTLRGSEASGETRQAQAPSFELEFDLGAEQGS